jgi:hypothetical protein
VSQFDAETVVAPSFEILEADMHRNVALLVSILVSFLSYPYHLLIDKPFRRPNMFPLLALQQ